MTREEAIKVASEMHGWLQTDREREALETFIPKLRESEDERIRKDIINLIYWLKSNPSLCSQYYKDRYDSILTWLEKQSGCDIDCPQKHQDNSQPNGCIVLEDFNSGEGFYKLNLDYLNKEQVEEVEEMVRTWNKDSKASNENIKACIGMCLTDANEQRFKDYGTNLKDCLDWLEKQKKQKQEWSESDKQNINLIISYLDSYIEEHNDTFGADECKYLKYWLKSLRPNQSKLEWSEEDEDTINLMIAILRENYSNCLFKTNSANTIRMSAISTDMLIKRIEALRPQPKQEWSKEDEKMLKWAIRIIVEYSDIDEEGSEIVQNWLESLRPQYHGDVTMTEAYKMGLEAGKASSWKPNDEQLRPLEYAIDYFKKKRNDTTYLESLYNDLKKL